MARPRSITTRTLSPPSINVGTLLPPSINTLEYATATLIPLYGEVTYGEVTYGTYAGSAGRVMPKISTREV